MLSIVVLVFDEWILTCILLLLFHACIHWDDFACFIQPGSPLTIISFGMAVLCNACLDICP